MPSVGASRSTGGVRPHRSSASHPPLRRARPRARRRSGPSLVIRGLVLLGMLLVLIAVTAVGATGFVAMSSIATLSQDLPDPEALSTLSFDEPTLVYDRTGKVQLGRFERAARHVVDYRQIPALVLDATTTAEDRTFWANDGYDVQAMVAAAIETLQGDGRGASTITQQLVRARLLPADVIDPGADLFVRKAKEIIQSARLTQAFPGQTGKQQIITAYLNQVFYGHDAYGIAAAAQVYFGISNLADLTPAQAALLAALPQSPSMLDPYRYAVTNKKGQLVVPQDAPPIDPARLDPRQPRRLALDAPDAAAGRGGQDRAGDPARRPAADLQGAATSCGRCAASWSRSSGRPTPSRPAATGSSRPSTGTPSRSPSTSWRRRPWRPTSRPLEPGAC